LKRGCCWQTKIIGPSCYFPLNFPNYEVIGDKKVLNESASSYQITKKQPTFLPNEILNLTVDLFYVSEQILRVKIYDKNNPRYEVPLNINGETLKKSSEEQPDYYVNISDLPFSVKVFRKSTGNLMFVYYLKLKN
jgi:hypothetical protein